MKRRIACPIHHGDNPTAFYVDPINGNWSCFTNKCHECNGNDVIGLVRTVANCGYQRACEIIGEVCNVDFDEFSPSAANNLAFIRKKGSKTAFPEIKKCNYTYKELSIPDYFLSKDISEITWKLFGGVQLDFLPERFALPLYYETTNVGYTCRLFTGDSVADKWIHLPRGNFLQVCLFGSQVYQENNDTVILVEGPSDVMKLHQIGYTNTLGLLGTSVGQHRFEKLMRMGVKNLILMLDPDKEGVACSNKITSSLGRFFNITNMSSLLPRDPSDCTEQELCNVLERQT